MKQIKRHTGSKPDLLIPLSGIKKGIVAMLLAFVSLISSAQVINNTGASITVTNGTVVGTDSMRNSAGYMDNDGILNMTGSFLNAGTTDGDGFFNLNGNWINTGVFLKGTGTVRMLGNSYQSITSSGNWPFNNLVINNTGAYPAAKIELFNVTEVDGDLSMTSGIIETRNNKLYLKNRAASSLIYLSGRIIGKFERGINSADNYLFPVGDTNSYNPVNLDPNVQPTHGSVLTQFIKLPPSPLIIDPPLQDSLSEIYEVFDDGYWYLDANEGFVVNDYNISLDGSGFNGLFDDSATVIKKDAPDGDWELDGTHRWNEGTVAYRDSMKRTIKDNGNHFGFGRGRPRILNQPDDLTICEWDDALFSVWAVGPKPLEYEWQVNDGSGWVPLTDAGLYTGTDTDELNIDSVLLSMDGYQYRVRVEDRLGRVNYSKPATLTVEPRPTATATPDTQIICNETYTSIGLTSDLPGTYFAIEVVSSGVIQGATPENPVAADSIQQLLTNPTDAVDSVVYRVIPFGPGTLNCEGYDDTVTIYVNPTPRLLLSAPLSTTSEYIYCNGDSIEIAIGNEQIFTGDIKYDLETRGDSLLNFTGYTASENDREIFNFTDTLSHDRDSIQEVIYRFSPFIEHPSGGPTCYGVDEDLVIRMVPKLKSTVVADTVYGGFNITCNGLEDGEIDLSPVGGDYRYNYDFDWRESDSSGYILQQTSDQPDDQIAQLPAGIYYYSITDILGCFHEDTTLLIEPEDIRVLADSIANPICYGQGYTGDIYLDTIRGGAEIYDYSYNWISLGSELPKGTDRNLIGVVVDVYRVVIEDLNHCTDTMVYSINSGQNFTAEIIDSTKYHDFDVSCHDSTDSWVKVAGNGVNPPYDYTWYDADYNVIKEEFESLDGSILENRPAGTYFYRVIDTLGCRTGDQPEDSIYKLIITEPNPIAVERDMDDLDAASGWDIPCYGDTLGMINIEVTGGHTAYNPASYTWSTMDGYGVVTADQDQESLTAGTYELNIVDTYGCLEDTAFILEQPPPIRFEDSLRINDVGPYNITCNGDTNGEIYLLNLRGGGPKGDEGAGPDDYTYAWTTLSGTEITDETQMNQTGLGAGDYQVQVTDNLGCSVDSIITLVEPDTLITQFDTTDYNGFAISCYEASDGSISLTPEGGTGPYFYDWQSLDDSSALVDTLSKGTYTVLISDQNGCDTTYSWILHQPDSISINPDPDRLVECFGSTSDITVEPTGGVGGYTFTWEGEADDRVLDDVPTGTYYLVVRDANGCMQDDSIFLPERPEIIPELQIMSDYNGRAVTCHDSADAIVELSLSGGNDEAYDFEWNVGDGYENTYRIEELPAGTYSVSGTDASDCFFENSLVIEEPNELNISYFSSDPTCDGFNDGWIKMSVTGGTGMSGSPIYNYGLNGEEFLPDPEFENLAEDDYLLTARDANNCYDEEEVSLVAPDHLAIDTEIRQPECKDANDGSVTIDLEGGTAPYNVNGVEGGFNFYFSDVGVGEFIIEVVDAQGCILTSVDTIQPVRMSCLSIPNAFTPNSDGANDEWIIDADDDGSNDMYLYPDAELRIYNRWGELVYYTSDVASQPWDGTYKGRELPVDSYHYVLDLGNGDPPVTGNVTIIR